MKELFRSHNIAFYASLAVIFYTTNIIFPELDGLSKIDLRIPRYVQAGDSADLVCSYYLDSHNLYSVKWYKGRHEFYRFMPQESPPVRVFPVKGMKINVSLGWAFIILLFDSSVEDNKLCTNIECLEGKLKHAAAYQISDICI